MEKIEQIGKGRSQFQKLLNVPVETSVPPSVRVRYLLNVIATITKYHPIVIFKRKFGFRNVVKLKIGENLVVLTLGNDMIYILILVT